MQSTLSLPSLPGPLWLGASDKALSKDQIELFDFFNKCKQMNYAKLNC